MRIEILNPQGQVVNTIIASEDFAEQNHPGAWRLAEYQYPETTTADAALQAIDALERKFLMPRIAREAFIALAEERAKAANVTLEQLKLKNKGYAALKILDAQIEELRGQL